MPASAASFALRTQEPTRAALALLDAVSRLKKPTGILVFACGTLGERLVDIATECERRNLRVPLLLARAEHIFTDRGELDQDSALCGLIWSDGNARVFIADGDDNACENLAKQLTRFDSTRPKTALAFFDARIAQTGGFSQFATLRNTQIFGAGTYPKTEICGFDTERVKRGSAGVIVFEGMPSPQVHSRVPVRLLASKRRITRHDGPRIFELDGQPILEALADVNRSLAEPVEILLAFFPSSRSAAEPIIRPLRGLDPERKALLVAGDVPPGGALAFAMLDRARERNAMETMVREASQALAGSVPRFALYFGHLTHGSKSLGSQVTARFLRQRFPELPLLGLSSHFTLNNAVCQYFSTSLSIFAALS